MRSTFRSRHSLLVVTALVILTLAMLIASDAISFDDLFILTMP